MHRALSLALALTLLSTGVHAEIYRWVDENGKVHYGDKVPAKYAKTEQQKLNEQGLTVETRRRELTAEEREAIEKEAAEREKQRVRDAEQARYDAFLRSTYPSLGSLDRARDDRMAIMDGQVRNAEKSKTDAQEALQVLEERAKGMTAQGKAVPARLQDQIDAFRRTYDEASRRIGSVAQERENVAKQFAADRARLAVLLGVEPEPTTPPE